LTGKDDLKNIANVAMVFPDAYEIHVFLELISPVQEISEPLHRHVGHCVQMIEFDAKVLLELLFVFGL